MRIDNVPNFWIPESMRSRFEREDTLAGVLGLHGWEMFAWHNWRKIALWYILVTFPGGELLKIIDGVNCSFHAIFPLAVEGSLPRLPQPGDSALFAPGQGHHRPSTDDDVAALAGFAYLFAPDY